jgi:pilus assembly protein CpaB
MTWKTWIPLVVAVVLGLVAALVARESLKRNRIAGPPQPTTVKIVVVRGGAAPGQELTADLLTLGQIAAETPPPGTFLDVAQVAGRVASTQMFNGQPVVEDLLAPRGAGLGIQALVPKGMRAITVEVNETSGLAGMLVPGSHVDVISTLTGSNKDETVAATIVQNVLVQAVGQRLSAPPATPGDKEAPAPRSVTLVVTPRDAEAIELASSMGRTRLVLRGSTDRDASEATGVTVFELRGEDKERVRAPIVAVATPPVMPTTRPADPRGGSDPFAEEVAPKRTVTLIRGGAKTEVIFELPKADPNTAVTKTQNEPFAD